jgi:hypothetical protein
MSWRLTMPGMCRILWIGSGCGVIVCGIALYYVRVETARAYRAQGFSEGRIAQSSEVMTRVLASTNLPHCQTVSVPSESIELVTVKDASLFLIASHGRIVGLCRYGDPQSLP